MKVITIELGGASPRRFSGENWGSDSRVSYGLYEVKPGGLSLAGE